MAEDLEFQYFSFVRCDDKEKYDIVIRVNNDTGIVEFKVSLDSDVYDVSCTKEIALDELDRNNKLVMKTVNMLLIIAEAKLKWHKEGGVYKETYKIRKRLNNIFEEFIKWNKAKYGDLK